MLCVLCVSLCGVCTVCVFCGVCGRGGGEVVCGLCVVWCVCVSVFAHKNRNLGTKGEKNSQDSHFQHE